MAWWKKLKINIVQTLDLLSYLSEAVIPMAEALYSHLWEHGVSLLVEFRALTLSSSSAVYSQAWDSSSTSMASE